MSIPTKSINRENTNIHVVWEQVRFLALHELHENTPQQIKVTLPNTVPNNTIYIISKFSTISVVVVEVSGIVIIFKTYIFIC